MDPILTAVLGSMQADMARMDRVAMNMANAQTPAYKREIVAAMPFAQRLQADAPALGVYTDERPGTLRTTGRGLDVALASPGWFEVLTPQGLAYTRRGDFRLDAGGRLVTEQGYAVQGLAGDIVLPNGGATIDPAGRIFEMPGPRSGAAPLAQLKVVQFAPGAAIRRLGDGLLLVEGTPAASAEGAVQVRQGFLENANVDPLREMARLVETVRHFETLQKVAVGYDEMLGASIRKLGEVT